MAALAMATKQQDDPDVHKGAIEGDTQIAASQNFTNNDSISSTQNVGIDAFEGTITNNDSISASTLELAADGVDNEGTIATATGTFTSLDPSTRLLANFTNHGVTPILARASWMAT